MQKITRVLEESIVDMIKYDKENSVETVIKTVFETIMNCERGNFLEQPEQKINGNKGNGYYERAARGITKYFMLQIPRDRLSFFKSVFLEAMKKKDEQMQELALKLYVKGLTTKEIENVLKESFGKKLSSGSVSNITKKFEIERKQWQQRHLDEKYIVLFIDALWIPIRRNHVEKEAFYIVLGLKEDLTREFLGVYNIPSESAQGWAEVFNDLKLRGLKQALMVVADGLKGLNEVIPAALPGAMFQRCTVHKKRNVLVKIRPSDKPIIAQELKNIFKTGDSSFTQEKAENSLNDFIKRWKRIYPFLQNKFPQNEMDNLFAYLKFPYQVQSMVYTTNWLERANRTIRRTQKIRNSFPNEDSAMNLVCACLMEQEQNFYLKHKISGFSCVQNVFRDWFKELRQTQFS